MNKPTRYEISGFPANSYNCGCHHYIFLKKSVATYVFTFSFFIKVGTLSESIFNLVPSRPQKHEPFTIGSKVEGQ